MDPMGDGSLFLAWVQSQFWTLLSFSWTFFEQPDVEVAFEKPNLALFKNKSVIVLMEEIPNNHLGCIEP